MAHLSDRVVENHARVLAFLDTIQVLTVDDETCDAYGRIKVAETRRWGPKERAKRRNFPLQSLGFSDNDLWIAAIALQHELIVVSGDSDFARLAEISDLRHENWLPGPENTVEGAQWTVTDVSIS